MRGSTYKRKDGRWVGVVDIGKDEKGKRKQKYVYGQKEKEVRIKLNKLISDIENGEYMEPTNITLVGFLNMFYDVKSKRLQETTSSLYKMYIDVHFKTYFGEKKLKDIKPMTLDKFYNYKMLDNNNKPLSVNTVRKLHSFLKSAFEYAINNDYIKTNPCNKVELPNKKKYIPTIYTEDQFKTLMEHVKNTKDEIPIVLGAGLGLRRGEVFGLEWKNINFETGIITIDKAVVRFDKTIEKKPKTETSTRTVHAPIFVMDALKRRYDTITDFERANGKVMGTLKPQPYSERFKNKLKEFGLEHIRFHDLRHYNAVIMMVCGIPDKVAAERLGHSQVTTLRKVYQHVLEKTDEDASKLIEERLNGKQN